MWAVYSSASGTVLIAAGAFWLSFVALADLARRSGIASEQAWIWPLLVDGLIVVATVAAVALDGHRAAWYPWTLLILGALVSVAANAIHAVVAADTDMPVLLAAAVASVPPLVLLASTHLTVVLIRSIRHHSPAPGDPAPALESSTSIEPATVPAEPVTARELPPILSKPATPMSDSGPEFSPETRPVPEVEPRAEAARMREELGWSNKRIARELGVHASTIGRWLPRPTLTDTPETPDLDAEVGSDSSIANATELVAAGSHSPVKETIP